MKIRSGRLLLSTFFVLSACSEGGGLDAGPEDAGLMILDATARPDLGLGDPVEPDVLPSAVGLVWRALVLWLMLILLLTLANLAP